MTLPDLSLVHYFKAQSETAAAIADYARASLKLDLARIYERLAEVGSQHGPWAGLSDNPDLTERERALALAHYVVVGRLP